MNNNLSEIVLVVDRSGSMSSCRDEAQSGINAFIKEQGEVPGETRLTLVQFDTQFEFIHRGKPIKEVPEYTLVPRGMTALLDAVGTTINETGERLSQLAEADRPGLVVFAIITDGLENSSHEFTKSQIKDMIRHQTSKYSWQFTYLGANQDAFAEAQGLGIAAGVTMNFEVEASMGAYSGLSAHSRRMKEAVMTGAHVDSEYLPQEREKATTKEAKKNAQAKK